MLERGDDETAENTASSADASEGRVSRAGSTGHGGSKADPMELLRDRYARGELSEAQFEAKLERLLETEILEDARESLDRPRRDHDRDARTADDSRERELEYEQLRSRWLSGSRLW